MKALANVTLDQIKDVLNRYFVPLFNAETSICAITASPNKVEEVEAGFKRMGFDVERRELPILEGEGDEESENGMDIDSGEEGDTEKEHDGLEEVPSP